MIEPLSQLKNKKIYETELMMDGGRIVLDLKGQARSGLTVEDLLRKFRENVGAGLDEDRILLS